MRRSNSTGKLTRITHVKSAATPAEVILMSRGVETEVMSWCAAVGLLEERPALSDDLGMLEGAYGVEGQLLGCGGRVGADEVFKAHLMYSSNGTGLRAVIFSDHAAPALRQKEGAGCLSRLSTLRLAPPPRRQAPSFSFKLQERGTVHSKPLVESQSSLTRWGSE